MVLLITVFIGLSAVILVAGIQLARCGDVLAERTGLGGSLVGLVLIAGATSLPELAVNCSAVQLGSTDLAIGAIVGSGVFNLLILGVMEFMHGTSHRIVSPSSKGHAWSVIASIVMTALLAFFVLVGDPRLVGRFGLGPVVILVTYVLFLRKLYETQKSTPAVVESEDDDGSMSLQRAICGYLAMTAVIFLAARYLAPNADAIAARTGLGGTFVGTTFVAVTTSLPEVVTTLAAVRMGSFDLAVGNIFGSNAFNAAMLFPIDACYAEGPVLANVSRVHAMTASAVVMISSVVLFAMFHVPKRRYRLIAPDAGFVIFLSVLTIMAVYMASQ